MSVVAVKINPGTIDLCSDSFIGGFFQQTKIEFVKSFQVNNLAVGGSGSAEELSLFKIFCQNHSPATDNEDGVIDFFVEFTEWTKKKDASFKLNNVYILIYRFKVFYVNGLYAREIFDHWAVGAGEIHAKAALYLGHSAYEAVHVACELSPWCEAPINTITIEKGEQK
jgi:hypothetical protein